MYMYRGYRCRYCGSNQNGYEWCPHFSHNVCLLFFGNASKSQAAPSPLTKTVNVSSLSLASLIEILASSNATSDSFLSRSMRQGCRLASVLFVFVVDVMYYVLQDCNMTPRVKVISLPNKEEIINVQFADDTTILLVLEEENLSSLLHNIEIFGKSSRSKIALHKFTLLGWTDSPPNWLSKFDLEWGGPNLITRYLGSPFSISPNLKEMWEWFENKVDKKN